MSPLYKNKVLWSVLFLLIFVVAIAYVVINIKEENNVAEGRVTMSGDIGDYVEGKVDDPVHDPSIFKDGNTYYVVSTGILRTDSNPGGIFIRKSTNEIGGPWESIGEIPVPEWTKEYNINHLWAPQVVQDRDTFYMFYAASSFGSNTSAIGVMTSKTPGDIPSWEDRGPILTSDYSVDYNAIDPMVFKDGESWWMVFGSHFSGIKLTQLDGLLKAVGSVDTIASRMNNSPGNAIEAPTIIKRGEYYYLFTSWDKCCSGVDSTYKIAVGRSDSLNGPYVDVEGVPLNEGGGTILLDGESNQIGPGGQDILEEDGNYYMVYHYYDKGADGIVRMQIRTINWEDDWPSFNN